MTFREFDLSNNVWEAIQDLGYLEATPIQEQAIPILLEGKDLVVPKQVLVKLLLLLFLL